MSNTYDLAIAIGGAAGQGIATPGNLIARTIVRRGLHLYAYNAYQSIIRGGHIFLTLRVSDKPVATHGDKMDLLVCLNQDTMDRHLRHMGDGTRVVFNSDAIAPGTPAHDGVGMCGVPVKELADGSTNKLIQNTIAVGVINALLGIDFNVLEDGLRLLFGRKGDEVVKQNVDVARAGYDYAKANFESFPTPIPQLGTPQAVWTGNEALAMGGAAAGVKFYCAYPMSPATGVLHWMAKNAHECGIMVRQVEDEISVANMAIGAAHAGVRSMCATAGGGFALMTEAVGAAAMMEIPVVFINVMRAGPSTGVPTKTEQADLWQMLGASQGDFEKFIVAPRDALDAYNTVPELFDLVDHCQCPGMLLSDLLISEGTFSVDPADINMQPEINRGLLITEGRANDGDGPADPATREGAGYKRYEMTESGISPRAIPGVPGYVHVVATDEHDEDSVLISDEYTNPHKRRAMVEKRARKMDDVLKMLETPALEGESDASVTLIGFGSTHGVIQEAIGQLAVMGTSANHLSIKWIVPFDGKAVMAALGGAAKTLIVENNFSGQFARYLRSETGFSADGHIRKYDGEPFQPHHIVAGVLEHLAGDVGADGVFVPEQEIVV